MVLLKSKEITFRHLLAALFICSVLVASSSQGVFAQTAFRHVDEEIFFDKVRKAFHRKSLEPIEFQTYKQIINYWNDHSDLKDKRWLAYVMATAYHETRLKPVREGFKKSDKAARKHVKWMFDKRIISHPYHLADRETGEVYYGRGYVQLTWAQNYKKMGRAIGMGDQLYRNPDLVLNPDIASRILFVGMLKGHFRYSKKRRPRGKQKLRLFFSKSSSNWYGARNIINGDLRKNGKRIAGYGKKYNNAIRFMAAPAKPPVVEEEPEVIASPGEGEVKPSLPDTDIAEAPEVISIDTPETTEVDQPETGDAPSGNEINASGEQEGLEGIADGVVDVNVDTAGEVVPALPEEGELASTPVSDGTPVEGQPTDVLTDPAIEGPAEGDPEVTPIGTQEVVDTQPVTPVEPVEPAKPVAPITPVQPVTPVEPVEPAKPVEPTNPVEPVTPVEPVEPAKPVDPTPPNKPEEVVKDTSWWGTIKSYAAKARQYFWKF